MDTLESLAFPTEGVHKGTFIGIDNRLYRVECVDSSTSMTIRLASRRERVRRWISDRAFRLKWRVLDAYYACTPWWD